MVRASGRVVKVHVVYQDGSYEAIHFLRLPDGGWLDLDYRAPCELILAEGQATPTSESSAST